MQNLTAALLRLDPDGARLALILRRTFDYLYDGARTGRFAWRQLLKEEKHALGKTCRDGAGSGIRSGLRRKTRFFSAGRCGVRVRRDYTKTVHGVAASASRHSHVRHRRRRARSHVRGRGASDFGSARQQAEQGPKANLVASGRAAMQWIHRNVPIPANLLSRLPAEVVDAVMSPPSGAARVRELLRRVRGTPIDMVAIDTVCQQRDATRRVREAGTLLRAEGILVLSGSTAVGRRIAEELHYHLPKQHFMSIRVTYSSPANPAPSFEAAGRRWTVGLAGSRLVKAPDINAVV